VLKDKFFTYVPIEEVRTVGLIYPMGVECSAKSENIWLLGISGSFVVTEAKNDLC